MRGETVCAGVGYGHAGWMDVGEERDSVCICVYVGGERDSGGVCVRDRTGKRRGTCVQ